MDPGLQTMIFMGVVLKLPIVAACLLIWYAIKSEPDEQHPVLSSTPRSPSPRPRGWHPSPPPRQSCPEQNFARRRSRASSDSRSRRIAASGIKIPS